MPLEIGSGNTKCVVVALPFVTEFNNDKSLPNPLIANVDALGTIPVT